MNKNLGTAVTTLGIFAGTLLVHAQSGAGGGAAGAAGSGATASGSAAGQGSAVGSAGAGTATAVTPGTSGRAAGTGSAAAAAGRVAPGGLNTVGSAGISQPAGAPLVGGASTIQGAPDNLGGAQNTGGITASPAGTPGAAGTLPTGVQPPTAAQLNALPTGVRSALQRASAGGALNSITPIPGQPGTVRAVVTQNGAPMELVIGPNGQVLSRAPAPANIIADNLGNTQPGLPLTSLPANLQNSIQSRLQGAQVQSITRDDLANGSVLRVTALQNGVPTEFRFAANGTLLSAAPLSGAATSAFVPGGGALIPGSAVVMDDLPDTIQESIRAQLGDAEASRIMQQRSATGLNYVVSYDQNGRPMTMIVGPDGRILRNGPANVGATAVAAQGAGTSTNETEATRSTAMRLDDLPDDVENVLKNKAPYAEVRTITREQRVGGDVYVVAVRDGDRAGEITIDSEGRIVSDTRRELSALTPPPQPAEEKPQGMPYDELPVAIKNAIKAYTSAGEIRSITLGLDRDGRTVWDVIFYRDGRRDRMIVTKDGTLVRIEEDVSPALELDSRKAPVIAIGDLPVKVRETIRRQTDTVLVKEIKTKVVGDQTVYQVRYNSTNGEPVQLLVSTEGEVVLPEGGAERETSADRATATATVDREEPSPSRTVVPSEANAREREASITASGAAAAAQSATESGVAGPVSASANTLNSSTVKLSEVPEPVQNTVQKMAGSGTVQAISPTLGSSGVNYEVTFLENGKMRTVTVDQEGVVQKKEQTSKP